MNAVMIITKNIHLVDCLSVPSVIFWTKVPNLQGLLGRAFKQYFQWLQDIFSLSCVLCIIFQNGRYLPGLEPCLAHSATLPPVEI